MGRGRRLRGRWGLVGWTVCAVLVLDGCSPSPKEAKAESDGVTVSVTVAEPRWSRENEELTANGTIRAKDEVEVVAETQGKVVAVNVDTGSQVRRGDILVQLDNEVKKAVLSAAQANYDKCKSDWDRAQKLFAQNVISETDQQGVRLAYVNATAQLASVRKDFENTQIRSPLKGIVTAKSVSVGTMLTPGASVAHVIDISRLKLEVPVGENSILKIQKGQQVKIEADPYPGYQFSGTVFAVSPASSSSLTFPIEIDLKNDSSRPLYDGMLATARISLGTRTVWTVPRVAVVGSIQKPQVFVARNGVAHLKTVVVGTEFGTDVEILKGLEKGENVVTSGQNNLDDGSSVVVSESRP